MEGACASHFAKPVTSKTLAELCDSAVPNNTKLSTEWGIRLWKEWASSRGAISAPSQTENVLPVTTPLIDLPPKDLAYWLGKFVWRSGKKTVTSILQRLYTHKYVASSGFLFEMESTLSILWTLVMLTLVNFELY